LPGRPRAGAPGRPLGPDQALRAGTGAYGRLAGGRQPEVVPLLEPEDPEELPIFGQGWAELPPGA